MSRQFPAEVPELVDPLSDRHARCSELDRELFRFGSTITEEDARRRSRRSCEARSRRLASLSLRQALNGDIATLRGARRATQRLELRRALARAAAAVGGSWRGGFCAWRSRARSAFIAPDALRGDEALILARAGRREEALALVSSNLEQAKDIPSAEAKAGDVYRALGEADSAEAYYRRSLAESHTSLGSARSPRALGRPAV